jgi:hypothetical protein
LDLISFSSEFSFSSGYRSSNYDENIESEVETTQWEEVMNNSKKDVTDILGFIIDHIENRDNDQEDHNPMHVEKNIVKDNSLSTGLDEKEDFEQNKVVKLIDEDEIDFQQTITNSPTCNKTRIMNTMEENENFKLEEQESSDSLESHTSTRLPDLDSFDEESYKKEFNFLKTNITRKKLLFVGKDGPVLAESSTECFDDKYSSFTRVVTVDVDECWKN